MKSLTVLTIGIKDDNGAALIDLDAEPWTSLVSTTSRPQRDDLAEEVLRRYVSENLSDRPDMKRLPQPRNWDKKKLLKWLDDNPVTDTIDVEFLKDTVCVRRAAAERNAKARAEAKESDEKSGGAWYGPIPMLRLIMALVDSDEIRHAYMKRNDISNERIVLDNQKSVEKRARTVWELVADKWNDIKFEPETEVFEELHSEYSRPIKIPHHKVALLSLATPDKVQEKISTMNVLLQRLIRNWECSGQGDGGIDVINDCDKLVDHEFGQITNRSRGALHTRAAFLGTNQPYLLYFWEMLNKYQLLSTSFSELSSKISSKNGGKGVPSAINSYGEDIDSDIDEIDFSDVVSSSIEPSSRKSTRKDSSSHSSRKKPHTSSVDRNASFSLGLQRLAQSNIISSRMDMSAMLRTNILSLESEHRGLDMALMDDPPPRKKAKLEEQMTVIEAELTKLKSELNNMVATPPRSNLRSSPPHYNYDDIDSM